MHIDWSTLTFQTVNVLILIWLLARFLFRPVTEIVARRRDEANRLLADAEDALRRADEARADVERAHADIAARREKVITEAHADAETERAALLARTSEEMAKLRAEADATISRDRLAMEKTVIDHASELSIDIARRLLDRIGPEAGVDAFLTELCRQVRALSPQERAALVQKEGDGVAILTGVPLGSDATERIRHAVTDALGGKPEIAFRSDPAVIAGIELHSRHAVIRNSWRNDIERVRKELNHAGEPARQPQ